MNACKVCQGEGGYADERSAASCYKCHGLKDMDLVARKGDLVGPSPDAGEASYAPFGKRARKPFRVTNITAVGVMGPNGQELNHGDYVILEKAPAPPQPTRSVAEFRRLLTEAKAYGKEFEKELKAAEMDEEYRALGRSLSGVQQALEELWGPE